MASMGASKKSRCFTLDLLVIAELLLFQTQSVLPESISSSITTVSVELPTATINSSTFMLFHTHTVLQSIYTVQAEFSISYSSIMRSKFKALDTIRYDSTIALRSSLLQAAPTARIISTPETAITSTSEMPIVDLKTTTSSTLSSMDVTPQQSSSPAFEKAGVMISNELVLTVGIPVVFILSVLLVLVSLVVIGCIVDNHKQHKLQRPQKQKEPVYTLEEIEVKK